MSNLIDANADLVFQAGQIGIVRTQDIPQEFLDSLKDARAASVARAGDVHRVASIPTGLVETWKRQGFDVMREPIKAIVARLKAEGYDAFLATEKRV